MSQVSLFRKWRSKAFTDLVGQETVVKTLRNVLATGSPARAYLFCGPRGTGKTSTARIFAKALCCENGPTLEPCNQCSTCKEITQGLCLDVFEIDAASNTQVEKIRDFIVDKIHFAPAKARFKVYIIDEVHKLSTSSFNALLKTLEEPPSHVVFILATTHPHELLPTILSRCQRYDFRAFSLREIEAHLQHIAAAESLELDPLARQLLARSAQGSMRDALVLLEQAHHYSGGAAVTSPDVVQMLGLLPQETLGRWIQALNQADAMQLLEAVEEMHRSGQDFIRAVDLWVDHLRLLMLSKVGAQQAGLTELHETSRTALTEQAQQVSLNQILNWLKNAVDLQQAIRDGQPARIALELCLVQLCTATTPNAPQNLSTTTATPPDLSNVLKNLVAQVQDLQKQVKALTERPYHPPAQEQPKVESPPEKQDLSPDKIQTVPAALPPAPKKSSPPQKNTPKSTAQPENSVKVMSNARDFWPHLLQSINDRRLKAMMMDAKLRDFNPDSLTITLPPTHQIHFEYISRNIPLLQEVSGQLLQNQVNIEVIIDGAQVTPVQEQEHESLVKKASGLFGGRILNVANDTGSD